VERLDGCEVRRAELEQVLRLGQVLETVQPEVAQLVPAATKKASPCVSTSTPP
jgi:hypothetical protein